MPSYKLQRISESIKREIPVIIRKLNDPRVKNNFFDIVKADISGDMSLYNVYISSLHGLAKAQEAADGLNSSSSFIRKELADGLSKNLKLRRVPDIKFTATDYVEYGANMTAKINEICSKTGDE